VSYLHSHDSLTALECLIEDGIISLADISEEDLEQMDKEELDILAYNVKCYGILFSFVD
jgi:hypothetical protein